MKAAIALAAMVAGCASSTLPPVRYHNAPAVAVVDDRRNVVKPPASDEPAIPLYYYDGYFQRRISRALELPRPQRALGVNAFDEVPDSTWFTNRIGVREVSLDEMRAGPVVAGSPEQHAPFSIHSSKIGGKAIGFIVTDARGIRFLIKFDLKGLPEVETAAEIISGRLVWAVGYNVPETHIIHLDADDLRIAPDAKTKDEVGNKRPYTQRDLDTALALIERREDGRLRATASRMLEGEALGGHPGEGTRRDDPNDLIPHQLRRDLRGTFPLFAWLDHVDVKQHNSLDVWVADPADPKRHYVMHYLLDFGKTLGAMVMSSGDPRRGHEYDLDVREIFMGIATVGMRPRLWERRQFPGLRGVGAFDPTFHPGAWKPGGPVYAPLLLADRFDKFWGAKLVMRFSRAQLRAAVEAARLTDARSVEYLIDTLVARQRATAKYWFSWVNPLDRFALATTSETALCFDDLLLSYDLSPLGPRTQYSIRTFDRHARSLGERVVQADPDGSTCTPPLSFATDGDGYTIVRIETRRPGFVGTTDVHVARDPTSHAVRIVGIWRL